MSYVFFLVAIKIKSCVFVIGLLFDDKGNFNIQVTKICKYSTFEIIFK